MQSLHGCMLDLEPSEYHSRKKKADLVFLFTTYTLHWYTNTGFSYFQRQPCLPPCPCLLEESHRIDDISLNSLEEVEITSCTSYHGALEFVVQLSRCNAAVLKKVVLKYMTDSAPPPAKEVCEKIRGMWQPNIEVEFYVFSDRNWVRLYLNK